MRVLNPVVKIFQKKRAMRQPNYPSSIEQSHEQNKAVLFCDYYK